MKPHGFSNFKKHRAVKASEAVKKLNKIIKELRKDNTKKTEELKWDQDECEFTSLKSAFTKHFCPLTAKKGTLVKSDAKSPSLLQPNVGEDPPYLIGM